MVRKKSFHVSSRVTSGGQKKKYVHLLPASCQLLRDLVGQSPANRVPANAIWAFWLDVKNGIDIVSRHPFNRSVTGRLPVASLMVQVVDRPLVWQIAGADFEDLMPIQPEERG
jgi:hypothetical protein